MRKVEFTVYNFNELSDEAKKEAIEYVRNNRPEWLSPEEDEVKNIIEGLLYDTGYSTDNLLWSFGGPGSYAVFGGPIDLNKVADRIIGDLDPRYTRNIKRLRKCNFFNASMSIEPRHRYYGPRYELTVDEPFDHDSYPFIDKAWCLFKEYVENDIKSLSWKIVDALGNDWTHRYSDEWISDFLENNAFEFHDNGVLY